MGSLWHIVLGPSTLILLAAIMTAVGAVWTSQEDSLRSKLLGPAGLLFLAAMFGAIGAVWSSQQQVLFEREIARTNKDIANKVTGGNSFCYFQLMGINSNGTGVFIVVDSGHYPLYDVMATITDLQKLEKIMNHIIHSGALLKRMQIEAQAQTRLPIGDMAPSLGRTFNAVTLGRAVKRDFNVSFTARNGSWTELMRFRLVNGKWLQAIRVQRGKPGGGLEVLLKQIDYGYPRGSSGEVNWNKL